MRFDITSDTHHEAKIYQFMDAFRATELQYWLNFKNYGNDLEEIFIVLMCRNPEYNFKQRIRMDRKDKILFMDLMLDYNYFTSNITQEDRINAVAKKIIEEVPPILKKYKFKDFDADLFINDLKMYFIEIGWI